MKKFMKRSVGMLLAATMSAGICLAAVGCSKDENNSAPPVEEVMEYSVTFKDWDGTVLKQAQTVKEGSSAVAPVINPTRSGYKFTGWDTDYENVTSDLTVTAKYEALTYTVGFYDVNDKLIGEAQTVAFGESATAPQAPSVEGMDFVGWRGDYTVITENTKVYAEYRETPEKELYSVTFVGADGEYLDTQYIEEGLSASAPAISTYKKNAYFSGWSVNFDCVNENIVTKAEFSSAKGDGLKLYKNAGEDFKTLLLADIQTINMESTAGQSLAGQDYAQVYYDPDECVFDVVRSAVEANDPDYLVLMGDNIYSKFDFDDLRTHRQLMEVIDGFEIPWSIVFGNHDGDTPDTSITRSQIIELYSESEYFLFETEENAEQGDYAVSLYEKGSDEINSQFLFVYTHYNDGFVTESQLQWLEGKMQKLVDGEKVIPSVLFAHYPVPEMYDELVDQYDVSTDSSFAAIEIGENQDGNFGECNSYAYMPDMGLGYLIDKYQSTQSAFFGHNHSNNFSVEVNGVRYTHALKTGYYDQQPAARHLNGATLLTLSDNQYSIAHKYANGTEEGGTYSLRRTGKVEKEDSIYLDYVGYSLGVLSGKNKITLADGESASISFDVLDGFDMRTGSDNLQSGFYVNATAITSTWPTGSYRYFMKNGACPLDETERTLTDGIVSKTYKASGASVDTGLVKNHAEKVFARGNSVKFTVYADGTYKMFLKQVGETDEQYAVFREGKLDASKVNIANGFYLGYSFNRSIRIANFSVTGSKDLSEYNVVCATPILSGVSTGKSYVASGEKLGYVYANEGKVLSATDTLEVEFTLFQAPATISSAKFCGFIVTSSPAAAYPYNTSGSSFMHYFNQEDVAGITAHGDGKVTGTKTKHDNSYLKAAEKWPGTAFFKSYFAYKFVFKGDGTFSIFMKNVLDTTKDYELATSGAVSGLNGEKSYYVGFTFFGTCKLADLKINGSTEVKYNNCTVS